MRLDEIDLTDLDRFQRGFPHEAFTTLRREAPVWWHPPTPRAPGGEGFWVVSRHAVAKRVLLDTRAFSSESGPGRDGGGTTLVDYPRGQGPGQMITMTDPPAHTRLRRLVNHGFTPRRFAQLESGIRERAGRTLDAVMARGEGDFLVEVAAELPLQVIAEVLGVPQNDRHQLIGWANAFTDQEDGQPAGSLDAARAAAMEAFAYAHELIELKRAEPGDDILSELVRAELPDDDGGRRNLDTVELDLFFVLLLTAGSETTRNAIAGGVLALIERPEAWQRLRRETAALLPTAIEELLRWTSPTAYNRRTATEDVVLEGERIAAGDKVSVWYASANRDEAVFAEPFSLDLARRPNEHLAFGHGPHLCLGAPLARLEMRVVFEELLARVASVELDGAVEWMRTNKFIGLRHMPVRFTPARRVTSAPTRSLMTPNDSVPARYMAAVNAASLEGLRALFREDVVLHHPMGVFEGRELVLGFYENAVFRAKTNLSGDGPVLTGGRTVAQQMLGRFPEDNGFGMPIPDQRAMDLFECDADGRVATITIYYLSFPSRQ